MVDVGEIVFLFLNFTRNVAIQHIEFLWEYGGETMAKVGPQ